jgi:uncharacterized protein (DUF2236 family)
VSDPRFAELWEQVLASWNEDAAHHAFIEHCRVTRQLGEAARMYRAESARAGAYRGDQGRVERAQKKLAGIALLATMDLETMKISAETERIQTLVQVVRWGGALLFLAVVAFTMAHFLVK